MIFESLQSCRIAAANQRQYVPAGTRADTRAAPACRLRLRRHSVRGAHQEGVSTASPRTDVRSAGYGSKSSAKIASVSASSTSVAVLLLLSGSVTGEPTTAVAELDTVPLVPGAMVPLTA